jgi:hypothetical protein
MAGLADADHGHASFEWDKDSLLCFDAPMLLATKWTTPCLDMSCRTGSLAYLQDLVPPQYEIFFTVSDPRNRLHGTEKSTEFLSPLIERFLNPAAGPEFHVSPGVDS